MSDSPIFIVGCPRSGTMLLRELLRSHPRISIPGESHFIPMYYRAYGDPRDADEARRLAARILRTKWVKLWRLSLEPEEFSALRTYADVLDLVFGTWAASEGKARWGDKTPHNVLHIPTLLRIFPKAKIIHIYRDGRDVCLSWLLTRFDPSNLYTAARQWRTMVSTGRADGAAAPPGAYYELRYEDLLANPEVMMRGVCAFIEEEFDPAVLECSDVRAPSSGRGLPYKRTTHSRRNAIVQDNFGKWRTRMTAKDVALFETLAGDLLAELGYETGGEPRPISSIERAYMHAHNRAWWIYNRIDPTQNLEWYSTFVEHLRARSLGRLRKEKHV